MNTKEYVQALVEDLKNSDQSLREKAVTRLMEITDPGLIKPLARLTRSENEILRIYFCRFLGTLKHPAGIYYLITMLLDESDRVAKEAAAALDKIDHEKKTDGLVWILKKGNEFSKNYAIRVLGETQKYHVVPHIIRMMPKMDSLLKETSIEALRQLADPRSIKPLSRLLSDSNANVRFAAAFALGEMGNESICPALMKLLYDENSRVRQAGIWALGKLGYKEAVPSLIKMLKTEKDHNVRCEIVTRLGKLDKEHVVRPLIEAKALDEDQNVKMLAEWTLNRIPPQHKIHVLMPMAKDPDSKLRSQVLLEIGKVGDKKYFQLLIDSLKDDSSSLARASAAAGLGFMGLRKAIPFLEKSLDDEPIVQEQAMNSFAKLCTIDDVSLLKRLVSQPEEENLFLQESAIRIIGEVLTPQVLDDQTSDLLISKLKSPDTKIRYVTSETLGAVGGKQALDALKKLVKTEKTERIIRSAEASIAEIEKRTG
jgi:HEAT repeat protein